MEKESAGKLDPAKERFLERLKARMEGATGAADVTPEQIEEAIPLSDVPPAASPSESPSRLDFEFHGRRIAGDMLTASPQLLADIGRATAVEVAGLDHTARALEQDANHTQRKNIVLVREAIGQRQARLARQEQAVKITDARFRSALLIYEDGELEGKFQQRLQGLIQYWENIKVLQDDRKLRRLQQDLEHDAIQIPALLAVSEQGGWRERFCQIFLELINAKLTQ